MKLFQTVLISQLKEIANPNTRESVRLSIGQIIYNSVIRLTQKQTVALDYSNGSDWEKTVSSEDANDDLHIKQFARMMTSELRRMKIERQRDLIRLGVEGFLIDCVRRSLAKRDGNPESGSETSVQLSLAKCDP